jgi:hypothetical protein
MLAKRFNALERENPARVRRRAERRVQTVLNFKRTEKLSVSG